MEPTPEDSPAPKPKRPLNAFMIFSQEKRPEYRGSGTVTEVAKKIGEAWRELSPEEQSRYKQMAVERAQA